MWHDDNDDIMKLYDIINVHEFDTPLPAACPICGIKSGHIYMHRYDEVDHGSLWLWCSSCHSFSHSSCRVPDWWRNLSSFTVFDLHAVPDNLDKQAAYIDGFVNKLLAIKDDIKAKATTTTDIPCEKCGTNMINPYSGSMGLSCPNCGWGWVTSYYDPIVRDTTEYQIKLVYNIVVSIS